MLQWFVPTLSLQQHWTEYPNRRRIRTAEFWEDTPGRDRLLEEGLDLAQSLLYKTSLQQLDTAHIQLLGTLHLLNIIRPEHFCDPQRPGHCRTDLLVLWETRGQHIHKKSSVTSVVETLCRPGVLATFGSLAHQAASSPKKETLTSGTSVTLQPLHPALYAAVLPAEFVRGLGSLLVRDAVGDQQPRLLWSDLVTDRGYPSRQITPSLVQTIDSFFQLPPLPPSVTSQHIARLLLSPPVLDCLWPNHSEAVLLRFLLHNGRFFTAGLWTDVERSRLLEDSGLQNWIRTCSDSSPRPVRSMLLEPNAIRRLGKSCRHDKVMGHSILPDDRLILMDKYIHHRRLMLWMCRRVRQAFLRLASLPADSLSGNLRLGTLRATVPAGHKEARNREECALVLFQKWVIPDDHYNDHLVRQTFRLGWFPRPYSLFCWAVHTLLKGWVTWSDTLAAVEQVFAPPSDMFHSATGAPTLSTWGMMHRIRGMFGEEACCEAQAWGWFFLYVHSIHLKQTTPTAVALCIECDSDAIREAMPLVTDASCWVEAMTRGPVRTSPLFEQAAMSVRSTCETFLQHRSWILQHLVCDFSSWASLLANGFGIRDRGKFACCVADWARRGVALHAKRIDWVCPDSDGPLPNDVIFQLSQEVLQRQIDGEWFRTLQRDFCRALGVPSVVMAQHLPMDEYNAGVKQFLDEQGITTGRQVTLHHPPLIERLGEAPS